MKKLVEKADLLRIDRPILNEENPSMEEVALTGRDY